MQSDLSRTTVLSNVRRISQMAQQLATMSSYIPNDAVLAPSAIQATTMISSAHPHVPLRDGEIRILTLHAGEAADAIVCSLHVAVLDDQPVYEALSYTWGDPDVTETVWVGGAQVDVTVNLESALR
jgi:hypothetical protein